MPVACPASMPRRSRPWSGTCSTNPRPSSRRGGPAARSAAGPARGSVSTGSPARRGSAVPPIRGRSSARSVRPADGTDPGAWDYPPREALAYGSGLLAALPGGLAAPRCLAVEAQPDGTTRLWLEAVADAHPGPWPLDRYALVARAPRPLQRRLPGRRAPARPAVAEPGVAAGLRRAVRPRRRRAGAPRRPRRPSAAAAALSAARRRRDSGGCGTERERFLAALDRLPRTFCHHDAFRRNLLHRAGPEGEDLVAVDWAYAGHGAVGEELGQLVVASLFFFEAEGIAPRELDAACFAGYVAGLREAGWAGDERLVRLGFAADAALRTTVGLLRRDAAGGRRSGPAPGRGRPVRAPTRRGGGGLGRAVAVPVRAGRGGAGVAACGRLANFGDRSPRFHYAVCVEELAEFADTSSIQAPDDPGEESEEFKGSKEFELHGVLKVVKTQCGAARR